MADKERDDMTTGALPADLVRLRDASKETGIPARTIREWAARGKISKYKQAGYFVLVSLSEIRQRARIEKVS